MIRKTASRLAAGVLIGFVTATGVFADPVTDWNQIAIQATEIARLGVPPQTRAMSMVHAAIFDAVNSIERKYKPYAVEVKAAPGASAEAAAAAAAHDLLTRLFPQQKAITDAALIDSLKGIPDGLPKSEGIRVGTEVAGKIFALRNDDGITIKVEYKFGSGPGVYQATPPMNALPIVPQWRSLKPWVITEAKQFKIDGPPAVGSPEFAKDFNEVKQYGSRGSTARTNEQTAVAIHWAGSEVPPFNAVARAASAQKKLSVVDNARLFALLNMAMADSLIAGFEGKYTYNFWRPVTAIHNAGTAKNPAIAADAGWEPLLVTPPHPEYPSAHCLGAGAAVAVLQDVFGGDQVLTGYVYPPLGVQLKWSSFSQIAQEVENARVWAGIHYRTSVEHGTRIGRQVGEFALKNHMRPRT